MTIVFNYTCTSCDVSVFLNMLLLYNWQQLYVSVHIANETVHRRGGKPFSLRPSPLQCSVGPGAMARWTCYVQSRQLLREGTSSLLTSLRASKALELARKTENYYMELSLMRQYNIAKCIL